MGEADAVHRHDHDEVQLIGFGYLIGIGLHFRIGGAVAQRLDHQRLRGHDFGDGQELFFFLRLRRFIDAVRQREVEDADRQCHRDQYHEGQLHP